MSTNSIELRKVRDFSETLNATFAFLKENFRSILKSCLPVALPIGLVGAIITGFAFSQVFKSIPMPNAAGGYGSDYNPSTAMSGMMAAMGMIYGGYFILLIGVFLFYVSVYQYIVLYLSYPKDQITFQMVWSNSKSSILPLIGMSILTSILLVVGFLFFIIPGIYLIIPLAFTFIIYMTEKRGVFGSISRSFNLLSGEWWSSFGLALVMVILQYAISFVVILPFYLIMAALMVHDLSNGADPNTATQGVMSTMGTLYAILMPIFFIIMLITSIMQVICISMKYFSVVEAKEGVGMMQKVEQMQPTTGGI